METNEENFVSLLDHLVRLSTISFPGYFQQKVECSTNSSKGNCRVENKRYFMMIGATSTGCKHRAVPIQTALFCFCESFDLNLSNDTGIQWDK